jgi:hypothetical protein
MLKGISGFIAAMMALDQAPFEFHLTGSRCFGYESETSDWDFFVAVPDDGPAKLQEMLLANGFTKESNEHYASRPANPLDDTLEVWVHKAANIHVQVVRETASKVEIQKAMKAVPGIGQALKSLSKADRKAIWRMSRAVFEAGKKFSAR